MNIDELVCELKGHGVRPGAYSIGKMTEVGDEYTMLRSSDGWEVFYNERGNKNGLAVFETEDEACRVLLLEILEDPTTRMR